VWFGWKERRKRIKPIVKMSIDSLTVEPIDADLPFWIANLAKL